MLKRCAVCKRLDKSELCIDCQKELEEEFFLGSFVHSGYAIHYFFNYCGAAKRVVAEYKLKGNINISRIIAKYFSRFLENMSSKDVLFVPMPSSKRGLRERGFCQIEEVLFASGVQSVAELLVLDKKHKTPAQKSLNKKERIEKSKGKFCINSSVDKRVLLGVKKILLVDDIFTTGASVENATQTLADYFARAHLPIEIESVVFIKGGSPLE